MSNCSDQINQYFQTVKLLKESDSKSIIKLRHVETGEFFILKKFNGSAEIYRKLLFLKSPYMPEILEVSEEDGRVSVLEEFISGDHMDEMLKDALFNEKETRAVAMDICRALYALHSLGIVHRDVKPENIILRGKDAVLLDFDASREVKDNSERDTLTLGTTGFAAPEQYGISQTDGRADIYALGVTMNIMLTGEHPSVRLAPGRMGRIISRCIMVHTGKRYKDVRHLMEALS